MPTLPRADPRDADELQSIRSSVHSSRQNMGRDNADRRSCPPRRRTHRAEYSPSASAHTALPQGVTRPNFYSVSSTDYGHFYMRHGGRC
eukprot:3640140-Amphidinium_carterae.1